MLVKGESVEDCLAAHPQQADALKPLLQTSFAARQASAIEPRPEFKARARYQFHAELQQMKTGKKRPFWRMRWATVVSAVLVMLMASGGLVAAAGSSMPDSPLYPLKLAVEQAQLNFTFSDIGKANLYARFADKRVDEIIYMAQKGDVSQTEATAQRLDDHLEMISSLTMAEARQSNDAGTFSEAQTETMKATNHPSATVATTTPGGDTSSTIPHLPPGACVDVYDSITVSQAPSATILGDGAMSDFYDLLLQDAADNLSALYDLLATAPEAVKPAIEQAIAILESGYNSAISNISQ